MIKANTKRRALKVARDLVQNAVRIWANGGKDFHPHDSTTLRPSSSGSCLKKVVMSWFARSQGWEIKEEFGPALKQGTIGHQWMDEGIDHVIHGMNGQIIRIQPWEMECFGPEVLGPAGFHVRGTPDHILLLPDTQTVLMIDYKFLADFSYRKLGKEGFPPRYKLQVATYHNGFLRSHLGLLLLDAAQTAKKDFRLEGPFSFSILCALNKSKLQDQKLELCVNSEEPSIWISEARKYWMDVAALCTETLQSGGATFPETKPVEKWECGYCPFGPLENCIHIGTSEELHAHINSMKPFSIDIIGEEDGDGEEFSSSVETEGED